MLTPMPDDFYAYKQNYPPGVSDQQITDYYDGGDDVEWGDDLETNNDQQEKDKVNGTDSN